MTVEQLITMLQKADPKSPVLVPGQDHSYGQAHPPQITTALLDADGAWCEDYGEVVTPEADFGKRYSVVVLG